MYRLAHCRVCNSYLAAAYDPMQGLLGLAAEVGLPLPGLPAAGWHSCSAADVHLHRTRRH